MVALFEMAPSLDRSMELLLKGVLKLAEAYTDLEVLEEALRIINRKRMGGSEYSAIEEESWGSWSEVNSSDCGAMGNVCENSRRGYGLSGAGD
ncbi:hypothetical protein CROQUDRAFT_94101 [Cronartium quercuum f. sp. fusiforme G11]|uniref:Uncharacterized protein n=1 Tax=Cronartium quercuum f. sp. fusiforme G11 TaxID=708437 RepID=A0A9P6NJD0_9BASI|nr:hypothetical protein CROQUDRAFT_94101 [Cronartium quercuum f. sp. fusiforme G11]